MYDDRRETATMTFFKKSDLILIVLLVFIALGVWWTLPWLRAGKTPVAEIYEGNRLVKTVALTEGQTEVFHLEGIDNVTFRLNAEGSIQFLVSDCPDQICVQTGKLSKIGETAACLPNNLLIKIVPRKFQHKDDHPDIIVH
ncbi:MAG: NusG domain II-containing protein [Eubacteriaceae bacterium]|nr:NusG domain II-containing protein [Eubacteriaceae bacterium]